MQERHTNRKIYFEELAHTSKKHYIPYIERFLPVNKHIKILEIGCGDGGNLLPFVEIGCSVTGVDLAETRIKQAREFFKEKQLSATFIASDVFQLKELQKKFDLILIHDVIEHIEEKKAFMEGIKQYIREDGIIFMGFPAWQMPFGGHQQICRNKLISHWPFLHLLPDFLYKEILKLGKENEGTIQELLAIKKCRTSIEKFENILKATGYEIKDRTLYFINPHYETKFGLKPKLLARPFTKIPYFRNYMCTSCFYILTQK